jgi:hypothetical protein
MQDSELLRAVERFAEATRGADEARLERAWAWGAYSDEGVRFAFFRSYEELRELAARVVAERVAHAPSSTAQRILAQYHAAYRDLWAMLDSLEDSAADAAPAEGEWPVRATVAHMVEADAGFFVVISYALGQHRAGIRQPDRPPAEYWIATLGDEQAFEATMHGRLSDIRPYHDALHDRLIDAFARIDEHEIDLPSRYWEGYDLPLRFRLHRLESHLRQHTVQVEKALAALGRGPSETQRLTRLLYAALADVEGVLLGAEETLAAEQASVAASIAARADEIATILA